MANFIGRSITYNGKTYKSLTDLCRKLNLSYNTIRKYKYKGVSLEEAIKIVTTTTTITYNGKTYKSIKELCNALNLSYSAIISRMYKQNMSLEEAITAPARLNSITYKGKTYKNLKELCRILNLPYSTMFKPKYKNLSLEEKIDTIKQRRKIKRTIIYKNKTYDHLTEIANDYDVDPVTFYNKFRNGMSIDEIINAYIPKDFKKIKIAYTHDNTDYYECIYNNQKYILSILEMKVLSKKEKENG